MAPKQVFIYQAPHTACNADEIASWVSHRCDTSVEIRDGFLDVHGDDALAEPFAKARVLSPYDHSTGSTMYGIVQYEERMLASPERSGGVLYDGHQMQQALNGVLPDTERTLETLHIAFLDRHLATWGQHDGRWHKRIAILGQPTLISVPGLAEAPAKPDAYYTLKHQHALVHGNAPPRELLEAAVQEEIIVPDDPRTTEALKGYALAGIHLIDTGEAFCDDPACRLFNGHRHREVIRAQLTEPAFCEKHGQHYGDSD